MISGDAMNIERAETAYYRLPLEPMGDAGHGDIDTEELITLNLYAGGLTGHGYSYTIGRGGRAVRSLIDEDIAPMILGQDANDIPALWDLMWQRLLYVGRGGLASFAIAAVDVALWDLYGIREGKPLYATLGAEAREIPAYGSGVDLPKPLGGLLTQTEGFLERGFPGVKVKIGRADPREDEERVEAVRALIGDDVDLMVDANMAWDAAEALQRGRRLERFDLYWCEEPTIPEDVSGHARISRELDVPLAVGESLHSSHEFRRYVDESRRGLADRSHHQRRHNRLARGPEDGRPSRTLDQQPLHRRAERPPSVRLEDPRLPREARFRAGPLPRETATRHERPRPSLRVPW